ncbi:MAG: alpha/beta hydrolase-fold protein [Anaerolineales bacterium]|nr:alpha/beta hydrolase-fold protein [Anaerolineales bacterium]
MKSEQWGTPTRSRCLSPLRAWLLIPVLLLGSCAQPATSGQNPEVPTSTQFEPTAEAPAPVNTLTPTAAPSAATPTSQQDQGCSAEGGTIESLVVQNSELFRAMPVRVYLPPCYAEGQSHSYPTLYLLHGLQSTDDQWDELGIDEAADRLISSGSLPPFIIVMPWHRTGIDLTTAVPKVLVPYIDSNFDTRANRRHRAVGGLSRGGGQALEIGLNYPELFGAVGMHSPAVPHTDATILDWTLRVPIDLRPRLWIDIGYRDSLHPAARSLVEELQGNAVPITIQFDEGDHLASYWESHLEGYLRWYAQQWVRASFEDTDY